MPDPVARLPIPDGLERDRTSEHEADERDADTGVDLVGDGHDRHEDERGDEAIDAERAEAAALERHLGEQVERGAARQRAARASGVTVREAVKRLSEEQRATILAAR